MTISTTDAEAGLITREYRAIRDKAALLRRSGFAMIEVGGRDAADYLHRRFSQGVKAMHAGRGAYGLLLEGDGRLSFDVLIYRTAKGFILLVPESEQEQAAEQIEKYVIMDDVVVVRAWEAFDVVSIAGPGAPDVIAAVGSATTPEGDGGANVCTTPWKIVSPFQVRAIPTHLMRDGRWLSPMYHVAVPKADAAAVVKVFGEACTAAGGGECGERSFEAHRLLEGIPVWGVELRQGMIPLEAGLTAAIDFNKGCFPGQEFLARIRNLGHPAHLLARILIEGEFDFEAGAEIEIEGEVHGALAGAASFSGLGQTCASGYIDWGVRKETACLVRNGEARIAGRIVAVADRETYDTNKKPTL